MSFSGHFLYITVLFNSGSLSLFINTGLDFHENAHFHLNEVSSSVAQEAIKIIYFLWLFFFFCIIKWKTVGRRLLNRNSQAKKSKSRLKKSHYFVHILRDNEKIGKLNFNNDLEKVIERLSPFQDSAEPKTIITETFLAEFL